MSSMLRGLILFLLFTAVGLAETTTTLNVRGNSLTLHLYGDKSQPVVLLSSGDLGWAGFVVSVAEFLSGRGYSIVGLNSKEYLSAFTSKSSTLKEADVMADYKTFISYAQGGGGKPLVLAGVSEGAGLSVLAATSAELKSRILGVVALGLPGQIELGWKWSDFTIWFTKKNPDEPHFMVSDIIASVSPVPLAEIHSTHDEFLPVDQAQKMLAKARPPAKMWVIEAANHRFSNNREELNQRLLEALSWIKSAH